MARTYGDNDLPGVVDRTVSSLPRTFSGLSWHFSMPTKLLSQITLAVACGSALATTFVFGVAVRHGSEFRQQQLEKRLYQAMTPEHQAQFLMDQVNAIKRKLSDGS